MLQQLPKPVIFAHRGACAYAPENTLASFILAADLGAPAVELDVKLTKDHAVVVLHDPTLERTTDGQGLLAEMTLSAVKALDAGLKFHEKFRGESIPTLAEVFEAVGQRVFVNVELTNYSTPLDDLVDHVVEVVKACHMETRVLFSSFLPSNLVQARQLLPDAPLGWLSMEGQADIPPSLGDGAAIAYDALHPYLSDVTLELIQQNHSLQRRVHVWTVNEPADMRRLFAQGVDGIFTDDPALAMQVLKEGA